MKGSDLGECFTVQTAQKRSIAVEHILFVFIRRHFEVNICEAIAFGVEVAGLEDTVLPDHIYRDQILNPAGKLKLPLPLLLESAECL